MGRGVSQNLITQKIWLQNLVVSKEPLQMLWAWSDHDIKQWFRVNAFTSFVCLYSSVGTASASVLAFFDFGAIEVFERDWRETVNWWEAAAESPESGNDRISLIKDSLSFQNLILTLTIGGHHSVTPGQQYCLSVRRCYYQFTTDATFQCFEHAV